MSLVRLQAYAADIVRDGERLQDQKQLDPYGTIIIPMPRPDFELAYGDLDDLRQLVAEASEAVGLKLIGIDTNDQIIQFQVMPSHEGVRSPVALAP